MISTLHIVSLDPGGTTGTASYKLPSRNKSGRTYTYEYIDKIDGHEFGPDPHHKELWTYLTNLNPDVVIYEIFNTPDNPAVILDSVEYIGLLKLYCALTRKPIYSRSRAFKDVLWLKGDALKKLGLYHAGMPHRNDATRHLVHYIVCDLKRKEILQGLRT